MMEVQVQKKVERPFLQAEDLDVELTYEGATPSRKEISQKLAGQVKASPDQVIIRQIQGYYGQKKAAVTATLYKDKSILEKAENQPLIKRHRPKESKAEVQPSAPEQK